MKHLIVASILAMFGGPSVAAETATKQDILSALSGNTVMGTMQDGSAYAEYYGADGTIRANGYTGYWGIVGNQACFAYGDDPAGCWHLKVDGNFVTWMRGGNQDGTGSVLPGNPNNF